MNLGVATQCFFIHLCLLKCEKLSLGGSMFVFDVPGMSRPKILSLGCFAVLTINSCNCTVHEPWNRSLGNGVGKNGVRNRCPYRRCVGDREPKLTRHLLWRVHTLPQGQAAACGTAHLDLGLAPSVLFTIALTWLLRCQRFQAGFVNGAERSRRCRLRLHAVGNPANTNVRDGLWGSTPWASQRVELPYWLRGSILNFCIGFRGRCWNSVRGFRFEATHWALFASKQISWFSRYWNSVSAFGIDTEIPYRLRSRYWNSVSACKMNTEVGVGWRCITDSVKRSSKHATTEQRH